jgi:isocitrate dehydrogenase kinase/phosphatase
MPHKPVDELYTVLGRAKQGKTERYFALRRHLDASFDTFVHAPGQRGLVMIVFSLPSHDLVFKVIRDSFGAPKNSNRAEVMERYQLVFRHDRAGRLVDAQEFKRLRLPQARFMPALLDELLIQAAQSCRLDGDDLIIEHCYMERRLRRSICTCAKPIRPLPRRRCSTTGRHCATWRPPMYFPAICC